MSNEIINTRLSAIQVESNGSVITNGSFVEATSLYLANSDYPDADINLTLTFSTAPNTNHPLYLYARPCLTNTSPAPNSNFRSELVTVIIPANSAATQYLEKQVYDLPQKAGYYLENATGAAIGAGWQMTITPRTRKAL